MSTFQDTMNWYYIENNQQAGPVSQSDFEALVHSGKIGGDTKVWRDGLADWMPYGELFGAANSPVAAAAGAHRCAECGKAFPDSEMIAFENAWVCAACKPVFVQKLKEGINPAGVMEYAGFWIRFGAKFIDGIIIQMINFFMGFMIGMALRGTSNATHAAQLIATVIAMFMAMGYVVFFNGRFGATPGKMALKLKIIRSNGDSISYLRALGRSFAEILSMITLYIGYMMAGWDSQKRALHDIVCDTRVIKVQ
ncbi:MAG TPA: RDD family protein [Chthoniobacteraceae bacterium]|nr:RDD family protein [Chthoniobacteraceae bacterium]